jgi:GR25 family glycosyltransferase involved in LPS biosynthesis
MVRLNDLFSHIACVNLDRRPDRWLRMQSRFATLGIDAIERFAAVDGHTASVPADWEGSCGAYGCLQSHLALVKRARANGWPNLLIFEDDVVFEPRFNERFAEYWRQVPTAWDMLYLGASHLSDPLRFAQNLWRLTRSSSTFAYALNHTVYDANIELNTRGRKAVDVHNHALQSQFSCYCFHPHLAWVAKERSDIDGNTRDFWWLGKSLVMDGDELKTALHDAVMVIPIRPREREVDGLRPLPPTVEHFLRVLPGLELVLVEDGTKPSRFQLPLPVRCHHLFNRSLAPWSRGRCCNAGFREFRARKNLFLFHDGDIFLHCNELSAVLLMALQFDFVTSFSSLYELDPARSQVLLTSGKWTTVGDEFHRPAHLCSDSCVFTRRGCELVGEWPETGQAEEAIHSQKVARLLRVFESPGQAFRVTTNPHPAAGPHAVAL